VKLLAIANNMLTVIQSIHRKSGRTQKRQRLQSD